jgi:hypothetical protein
LFRKGISTILESGSDYKEATHEDGNVRDTARDNVRDTARDNVRDTDRESVLFLAKNKNTHFVAEDNIYIETLSQNP